MADALGCNAVVAGLAGVLIGLVSQIVKNWRRKSCEGLSVWLFLFMLYPYLSWLGYGLCLGDPYLCVPQTMGSICAAIILLQFWMYQKKDIMDIP